MIEFKSLTPDGVIFSTPFRNTILIQRPDGLITCRLTEAVNMFDLVKEAST